MKPSSGSLLISVHDRKKCVYNKHYQILKQYYQVFHRDQSLVHYFYINDIPLFLSNTEEVIYAADVTLTTICDDVKRIESNLFIDTKNALEWCKANDMELSLPKRLQNNDSTIVLKIDDTVIPWVSTTKIVGVHFDNALSWNVHIKHIYNKIVKHLYLLQQIKSFLPIDSRKLFYNSYILPHLDYCCIIWGKCSHTLEKLQKRASRIILDKIIMTTTLEALIFLLN